MSVFTWEAACEIEPGLRYLERLAEATAAAGTEPTSWPFFRRALIKLVGLYARRAELRSIEWQRLAHKRIRAALATTVDDGCCGIGPANTENAGENIGTDAAALPEMLLTEGGD